MIEETTLNRLALNVELGGGLPDIEHELCNQKCPHLVKWEHPFWHYTAWCWYMMKDLSYYDYWIAECLHSEPDARLVKIRKAGRTEPPNIPAKGIETA